jgi:hypothetical protein
MPRFRIRTLMIVVVALGCVLGIGIGAVRLWERIRPRDVFVSNVHIELVPPFDQLPLIAGTALVLAALVLAFAFRKTRGPRP